MRAPPCAQIFELLSARKLRRHLVLGVILQLSMQFSGIDAVFYYSTMAFRQAGVADPQMATTFLGALNVVLTVIAIAIMVVKQFGGQTRFVHIHAGSHDVCLGVVRSSFQAARRSAAT